MYSTCLFCNSALGRNKAVEHFPIGRRLAYDASKGRLWVVCRRCERWNLTPLEERWEAIEEAERLFRATRLRIATDNIGLARLREGLELVRIGTPPRFELACWRYADRFGRRRKRLIVSGVVGTGISVGSFGWVLGGPVATAVLGAAVALNVSVMFWSLGINRYVRVPNGAGGHLSLEWNDLRSASLARVHEVGDWSLTVHREGMLGPDVELDAAWLEKILPPARTVTLRGTDAASALASILPMINGAGGSTRGVRAAVDLVSEAASLHQLVYRAASGPHRRDEPNYVARLPSPMRLALEMALHEDDERRATEGELAALAQRWREAEEIAQIVDSLAVPRPVAARLHRLRQRLQRRTT